MMNDLKLIRLRFTYKTSLEERENGFESWPEGYLNPIETIFDDTVIYY